MTAALLPHEGVDEQDVAGPGNRRVPVVERLDVASIAASEIA